MERREEFTLKEIIMGLRPEYLANQQQLQYLKDLCDVDYKKVEDFIFYVFKSAFNSEKQNPGLWCTYYPKLNQLQQLVADFGKRIGLYIFDKKTTKMVTDNNKFYFRDNKFPVYIMRYDSVQKSFSEQAHKILNSDFSNNINHSTFIEDKNLSDANMSLSFTARTADFYIDAGSYNKILPSSLVYDAEKDTINFKSYQGKLNKEVIYKILNIPISKSLLNDYQVKIITENSECLKPVEIENISYCEDDQFSIQENESKFLLRRKRP